MISTNNIDDINKCEEGKAELCGIAEVSDQIAEMCASCGITEVDNVKLKKCACKLVKYCSIECQKEHRSKHKRACKKRLVELREELLFRQPESSHLGDCPICFLPLPLDSTKSRLKACCSKLICKGCLYASAKREHEMMLEQKCPFCREPLLSSGDEEIDNRRTKRVEAKDPAALTQMAVKRYDEGDHKTAFKYMKTAAEMGDLIAHSKLGILYGEGIGVEVDKEKELHHLEKAAMGGHPYVRYVLARYEEENGRVDRASKHLVIGAKLGCEESMNRLLDHYKHGHISKDDLDATLRAHQAAVEATKSPQREEQIEK